MNHPRALYLQRCITLLLLLFCLNSGTAETILISCETELRLLDNAVGGKNLQTVDGILLAEQLAVSRIKSIADCSQLPFQLYTLETESSAAADLTLQLLQDQPHINHATRNHHFSCCEFHSDSLLEEQWGLIRTGAAEAWELADGSGVVLAVIDTGIDWRHPDLREKIWFNQQEDNGNGTPFLYDPQLGWQLDPADADGVDDDGNGLVDDVIGFDFTHAPEFPAAGDYLTADRDPFDEHSHGTIVASVAGAMTGNGTGMAAVAPGVTLMPLRAANSAGFLQEDDVAAAIIYAVFNGAAVVNMSFGDTNAAPILHDLLRYAYDSGVVLVAASGNEGAGQLSYPAAYPEVIAVGAATQGDYRWPPSNQGLNLDLVAPGESILAAAPDNTYGSFSGTSLAAPFVSAAAAMLLEYAPSLTPALLRNTLRISADDLALPGHDNETGAGMLQLPAALSTPVRLDCELIHPGCESRWQPSRHPQLQVIGTVTGNFLASWTLQLGSGEDPVNWNLLSGSPYQESAGQLTTLDLTDMADGYYILQLVAQLLDGSQLPVYCGFTVDRSSPELNLLTASPALSGGEQGILFQVETDDPTRLELFCGPVDNPELNRLIAPYSSTTHTMALLQSDQCGTLEYYFLCYSSSGDTTLSQLYTTGLPCEHFYRPLLSHTATLPYGLLLQKSSDLNRNGRLEVWLTAFDPVTHYPEELQLWEYDTQAADFVQLPSTYGSAYVKDLGDINGDGAQELLSEIGGISYLFTQTDTLQPPDQLAWRSDSHWAANFISPGDPADGYPNLLLRTTGSPRHYLTAGCTLLGDTASTVLTTLDTLYNPFYAPGEPFATGVARGVEGDFDSDGYSDLLLSDNEGHLFMYEFRGPHPVLTWEYELTGMSGPGKMIAAGNFLQPDRQDFIAVWRTPAPEGEQEAVHGYRLVQLFSCQGDGNWLPTGSLALTGTYHSALHEQGLAISDLDNDGLDDLLLTLSPEMYLLSPGSGGFVPQVWRSGCNLSGSVTADFDGDGIREWLAGDEQHRVLVALGDLDPNYPPVPAGISGYAASPTSLQLSWQYGEEADGFLLYRQAAQQQVVTLLAGESRQFLVEGLATDSSYTFSLRGLVLDYPCDTSAFSAPVQLTPNNAPWIASITREGGSILRLRFSEPMAGVIENPTAYRFSCGVNTTYPSSVLPWSENREALLTVDFGEYSGMVRVHPGQLTDCSGTPLDSSLSQLEFNWVTVNEPAFFIRQGGITGRDSIRLLFNRPVDSSIEQADNYLFQPADYTVTGVTASDSTRLEFEIILDSPYPLGAYGRLIELELRNIMSLDSLLLAPEYASLLLQKASGSIDNAFIFPNPWRISAATAAGGVTIGGLPPECEIFIYDLTGRLLAKLEENDGDGGYIWDGMTGSGLLPTGIYIVMLRQEEQIVRRKLAVIE